MRLAFVIALALWPAAAAAWEPDGVEVDLELVLAVDVSRSMSADELETQRRGYAEALRSPEVIGAIESGLLGRIALTYIEWAGQYSQRSAVEWTLIDGPEAAHAFADRIGVQLEPGMRRTSISGALLYSATLFERNGFDGLRRVIDISGDGPNNQGRPVPMARDSVLSRGITINGLPLMTPEDRLQVWDIADLDVYYENCVIGGAGAFVVPVVGWDQFGDAVRRKMVLEIAGRPPEGLWRAQAPGAYDCLVGEKIWERYRSYWGEP